MNKALRAQHVITQQVRNKKFRTPLLLVIMGVVGAGKSTLAQKIIHSFPFYYAAADNVRVALCPNPNHCMIETKETYTTMYQVIKKLLRNKKSVLLDATLPQKKYRTELRRLFGSIATIILVHITASKRVIERRTRTRTENLKNPLRITFQLNKKILARFNSELQSPDATEAHAVITFPNNTMKQFTTQYHKLSTLLHSYIR